MNNFSSYSGLTDSRMRAYDTDLPVQDPRLMAYLRKIYGTVSNSDPSLFHTVELGNSE